MPRPSAYVRRPQTIIYPPLRRGFPGLSGYTPFGGFSGSDYPGYGGGDSLSIGCGCTAPGLGSAAGIESAIKARPFVWVAGAFLLGYLIKAR